MAKILKNNTQSNIFITDTGISILANSQYTIPETDYLLWAASSNVITEIGNAELVVNDGSADLSISDGTDLIKGLFPKNIILQDIGGEKVTVTNNRLDTNATFAGGEVEFPQRQQDAFGNPIFVEPTVIFSTHFSNSDHSKFLWNKRETSSGTVTHNQSISSMELSTTTTSGSKAEYQTYRSIQYIPGQAMEYITTQVFITPKTNLVQRVGMRDSDFSDGIYWEVDSTTINCVVKGVTLEKVPRANWYDPLDGTGPSGLNLDFAKGQILVIHYQWLGYGDVEFGVQIGNKFIKCHTIEHHGSLLQPYTHTPSFNGFAEIENIGTTGSASTMKLGCFSVKAYGNVIVGSNTTCASNETTLKNISASVYAPIIGIRLKAGSNNSEAILEKLRIFSSSSTDMHYELLFNATINGGAWSDVGDILQKNTTITSYSGGYAFDCGYINKQGDSSLADLGTFLRLGRYLDGSSNTFLLLGKSLGGNADVGAAIILKELK